MTSDRSISRPATTGWALADGLALVGLLALLVAASEPLLRGFIGGHDWMGTPFRVFELDRSLRDGVLYPRWSPDLAFGFGYPVFNYYAPLTRYLAEAVHLASGASIIDAVRIAYGGGFAVGTIGMYLLLRRLTGNRWAAWGGAVAYLYLPYHLVQVYVRGDIAEFWAASLFPWALWAALRLERATGPAALVIAALTYAGVVLAHNIMAIAFSPLLAMWLMWRWVRRPPREWLAPAAVVVLGLALSAFYWAPAYFEKGLVHIDAVLDPTLFGFRDHFVMPWQLVSTFWDYGNSLPGDADTMSLQIGWVHVLAMLLGIAVAAFSRRWRAEAAFWFAVFAVATFLMLPPSEAVWDAVPLLAFFQFPWRWLTVCGLAASVVIGLGIAGLPRGRASALAAIVVVALVVGTGQGYVREQTLLNPNDGNKRMTLAGLALAEKTLYDLFGHVGFTVGAEYLPLAATAPAPWSATALAMVALETSHSVAAIEPPGVARLVAVGRSTVGDVVELEASQSTTLVFNRLVFPGWQATLDGAPTAIVPVGAHAAIGVAVPTGRHRVALALTATPLQVAASAVSWIALLGGVVAVMWRWLARSRPPFGRTAGLVMATVLCGLLLAAGFPSPGAPPTAALRQPSPSAFANGARLSGVRVPETPLAAGESVAVEAYWQTSRPITADYMVYVHVLAPSGERVAQWDGPAVRGLYHTSQWRVGEVVFDRYRVELPYDLPGGDYRLILGMYTLPDVVASPVVDGAGREVGRNIELGTVAVPSPRG